MTKLVSLLALLLLAAVEPPLTGAREPGDLVVATFNIRYGTAGDGEDHWSLRHPRCITAIRKLDADVLGLQEALRFQIVEIAEAVPGYTIVGVGRDDGAERGEHCAIMIRDTAFETVDHGTVWLSDTPTIPGSKSFGNDITRICTWALLRSRSDGATLRVLNIHLDHRSNESRVRSVDLIRTRLAEWPATDAVVVMGDFNAGPESKPIRDLLTPIVRIETTRDQDDPKLPADNSDRRRTPLTLRDAWRFAHPESSESEGTYHAFSGASTGPRIDFIFVDDRLEVKATAMDTRAIDGRWPSDHHPVVARVRTVAEATRVGED